MKRLLSIFLAIAMLITFIPAVSAEGEGPLKITYDFLVATYDYANDKQYVSDYVFEDTFTLDNTGGFYEYKASSHADSGSTSGIQDDGRWGGFKFISDGAYLAFDVNVPESGTYVLQAATLTATDGKKMNVYHVPSDVTEGFTDEKYLVGYYLNGTSGVGTPNSATGPWHVVDSNGAIVSLDLTKGANTIVFECAGEGTASLSRFWLVKGNGTDNDIGYMGAGAKISKTSLTVGETAVISTYAYKSDLFYTEYKTKKSNVTLEDVTSWASSDTDVAKVDTDGNIEAVGAGRTTISKIVKNAFNGEEETVFRVITVFGDPIEITYDFLFATADCKITSGSRQKANTYAFVDTFTLDNTGGFYKYRASSHYNSDTTSGIQDDGTWGAFNFIKENGGYLALDIYVPEAGIYTMCAATLNATSQRMNIYHIPSTTDVASFTGKDYIDSKYLKGYYKAGVSLASATKNLTNPTAAAGPWNVVNENLAKVEFEFKKGFNTIVFEASEGTASLSRFVLKQGDGTDVAYMGAGAKLSKTSFIVGESAEISTYAYNSDLFWDEINTTKSTVDLADVTKWASSDTTVAMVDEEGNITAVGAGRATISKTVENEFGNEETVSRDIVVYDIAVSGTASFAVYSEAGTPTVTAVGYNPEEPVNSLAIGTQITVTADRSDENYIFRGWKRGSADNGVWFSAEETVSFPLMTHTFLTAVYDEANGNDTVDVEFYNYKGQYLDTAENVAGKAFKDITTPEPTLTGYTAYFWTLNGVDAIAQDATFEKLTRVVAKFTDEARETFDVTINSGITGAESDEYAYDTKLELSSESEGTWYVNNKPVACGDSYDHFVWDDADIEFKAGKTNSPIISLDATVKENGARMISYDANGKSIVEVGILFGEDATVESFSGGKAASKATGDVSGQFTAMPNSGSGEDARGYLIYNDSGTYRVIYAD